MLFGVFQSSVSFGSTPREANVSPASGTPCSKATINGLGYTHLPDIEIFWEYPDGRRNFNVASGNVDISWSFSLTVTVPGDAMAGTNWLIVKASSACGPGYSCPDSAQTRIPFQVKEESVGVDAYCRPIEDPSVTQDGYASPLSTGSAGVLHEGRISRNDAPDTGAILHDNELLFAASHPISDDIATAADVIRKTGRTALPATGLGSLLMTVTAIATLGIGLLLRRDRR